MEAFRDPVGVITRLFSQFSKIKATKSLGIGNSATEKLKNTSCFSIRLLGGHLVTVVVRKRKKRIVKELAVEIERLPQIEELAHIIKVSQYNEGYEDFDKDDYPITFLGDLLDLEVRINKDNQIDEEAKYLGIGDTEEIDDATDLTYVIKIEPTTPPRSLSPNASPPSATHLARLLDFEKSLPKTSFSHERLNTYSETPTATPSQSLTSVKMKVLATIGSPKKMSVPQSIAVLEENQFITTSEKMNVLENIPEKMKDISEKSNFPRARAISDKFNYQTESACNVSHDSETEKVENIRFLKQLLEKSTKDPQSKVTSANLNITSQPQSSIIVVNNGSTNEKVNNASITEDTSKNIGKKSEMGLITEDGQIPLSSTTTAGSLPALPPLTSNTKKLQPVATVKPLPTSNPSTKDNSDDDIEIVEEIIDVDKSQKKQYTDAFLIDGGKIVDKNNHVIGHLDQEKIKGIFVKQGVTLTKDVIKFIPHAGSSKKKIPHPKDGMENNLAVSMEDSSKKMIKPNNCSSEKKGTENEDSSKRGPKRKTEDSIVNKRTLPARSKKQKEDGFYKKFADEMEEDISNASDNDFDDPSFVPEEVDQAELLPFHYRSNETNGTDSNSIEANELDPKPKETENSDAGSIYQQNIPSTSGEIVSKEGTTVIKEAESSNVKKKRAMPLSIKRKKDEEKRMRMESEPKKDVKVANCLLFPKDKSCDEIIAIIPKLKEASSPSMKVSQEPIDNAVTISPTSVNKEVLTEDSFEQVDNNINSSSIQSLSVPVFELTTSAEILTKTGTNTQLVGQFCSPVAIENTHLTNYELINTNVYCNAGEIVQKTLEDVPEQPQQLEMETNISLMISNVNSLSFPDEDLVDVSPTTDMTYFIGKATRADLMNNLATHESIFKFQTKDIREVFRKVFHKPKIEVNKSNT